MIFTIHVFGKVGHLEFQMTNTCQTALVSNNSNSLMSTFCSDELKQK